MKTGPSKKRENDRFREINSPEFLSQLLEEGPGAEKAYRRLVEVTHGPMMNYARKFINSNEEAGEILQEVYLGVFKGIKNFEGKSKLTTWIYGMAHYKICDKLSDRFRQHEEYFESSQPEEEGSLLATQLIKSTAWELQPDKRFLQNSVNGMIREAVSKLPSQAKEIYYLRDVKGMSGEDVAEILDISLTTVRVRLHRARNLIVEMVKAQIKPKNFHKAGEVTKE